MSRLISLLNLQPDVIKLPFSCLEPKIEVKAARMCAKFLRLSDDLILFLTVLFSEEKQVYLTNICNMFQRQIQFDHKHNVSQIFHVLLAAHMSSLCRL